MTELTVRRFEPSDTERVRELNRVAMRETPEWVPGAPDEDLADVPGHYLDGHGEFLVGVVDGEVVATGAYEPLGGWKVETLRTADEATEPAGTVELTRLRVDPDHWGRGFGTRIYRELEARARSAGHRAFVLDTGAENDRARGFYESLGFQCVREVTVEFDDLSLDLALYRRAI